MDDVQGRLTGGKERSVELGREAAFISDWDFPIAGREHLAERVFREFLGFWERNATGGAQPGVTVWFHSDGASGLVIARGDSDALFGAFQSPASEAILNKAHFVFRDVKIAFYWGGAASAVEGSIDLFRGAGHDLGIDMGPPVARPAAEREGEGPCHNSTPN